jgi:hypothetical protein
MDELCRRKRLVPAIQANMETGELTVTERDIHFLLL